jgi:hypothetical protein
MNLPLRAAPGVEQYAETAIESACDLAANAGPDAWSKTAADDALDAIDTLAEALSALGPDIAEALAPVRAATTDTRRLRVPVRTLSPILLAYSVPGGAGGSLVGAAAAVLAFPVAGGVWNVDAAEAVAEGA